MKHKNRRYTGNYHYQPVSSLQKKEANAYRKTFVIVILTIGVFVVIYLWGVPFISNLSNFWNLSNGGPNSQSSITDQTPFDIKPRLDPLTKITNLSPISINGKSGINLKVILSTDNNPVQETKTDNDGIFHFLNIALHEGNNTFSVTATAENNESQSTKISVFYDKTKPILTIEKPKDKEEIKTEENAVVIEGITEPDTFLVINDHQVVIENTGKFSYKLILEKGINQIKASAKDGAGNETLSEINVTYSPPEVQI